MGNVGGFFWSSSKLRPVVRADEEEDDEDPVTRMLNKTGCIEKHYAVQECIAETKDWRKCQTEVQLFKECMNKYQNQSKPTA